MHNEESRSRGVGDIASVANPIRFSFLSLESFFKQIINDGFAADKAIIVLGCAQVAGIFTILNLLTMYGVRIPIPNFGWGVEIAIGVLIVFGNYRLIKGDQGMEEYRRAYRRLPRIKKVVGGGMVVVTAVASVTVFIVTSSMVSDLR